MKKEIFVHRSDERILKYIDIPKAETIEDARNFIEKINKGIDENEWVYWEITFKNDSQLIGTICL
jgi:ribosomal-protein-alanine N-acetyltransferase